jgi:hypothetical protein
MSIASKTTKTSIGLTLLAVCFIVVVPWISGQDSSPEALAKAGRTGPNSGLNSQVLNYKLVPWPLEAKSAAGFDAGPWNFIQVASVATHPNGNILVLHRGAHPLLEFEPSGKFVRTWENIAFSEGKVIAIPEKRPGQWAELHGRLRAGRVRLLRRTHGAGGCGAKHLADRRTWARGLQDQCARKGAAPARHEGNAGQ